MVDFAGWLMPIYYTGIIAEHQWTRQSAGAFDVSHLGEFHVSGPGAFAFLQRCVTNDLNKLKDGRILYSLLCDEEGRALDDLLIYQAAKDDYYVIVNAANSERDFEAMARYAPAGVSLKNHSDETACIAVQGPKSEAALEKLFGFELHTLGYYHFKEERFAGQPVWVSRSGYTGEDGFEIFSSYAQAPALWDKLIQEGKAEGVLPAGLGARNTLRLEAGNALYGNDVDITTTPLEAGLGWAIAFDKQGGFVGRESLLKQKTCGISRRLVGFKVLDKPVAREHYLLFKDEKNIGTVTSGSFSPSLGYNIGLGYVEKGHELPGTRIEIEVHGRRVPAEIVKLPFVNLKHKKGN